MKQAVPWFAKQACSRPPSRGITLLFAAFGMVILMGTAGLAVDLAYLYAARTEAQSAADAAALAAANDFASSGFTTGLLSSGQVKTLAAADAAAVGNANYVSGQNPRLDPAAFSDTCPPSAGSDGCFDLSQQADPRVSVIVRRTAAHGNPLPLFFMSLFGITTADVSAVAMAEAYNPSTTGGPPINLQSLKPWLTPNCDPNHIVAQGDSRANPNCPVSGGYASYYVYPQGSPQQSQVVYPGQVPNGVVGQQILLKPGSPSSSPAPSQFYPLYLPQSIGTECPVCVSTSSSGNGSGSAALYEQNIECWTPAVFTCGQQTVALSSGNMVGPTSSGVDCLIHEANGAGQDTMDLTKMPFQITAGMNNPYFPPGTVLNSSDSMVVVPLYDGSDLCPGSSCPSSSSIYIQGFLQVFIQSEGAPQGTVTANVMNVGGCGNWQTTAPAGAAWANPVVVRLIH